MTRARELYLMQDHKIKDLRCVSARCLVATLSLMALGCEPGGELDRLPEYRSLEDGEPSSGERGNMMITELNFAGSVSDDGTYDPDDVFVEVRNHHPRPINLSGWHLILEGDIIRTIRLPKIEEPVQPNEFFVFAAKDTGSLKNIGSSYKGIVLPELELGKRYVKVELRDNDLRLIESAGHEGLVVFAGGYDTQTARSMERVQLIFANQGGMSRNWHAYSDDIGFATVADGYRQNTLASPGIANSEDYSGSAAAGNFE